MAVFSNKDTDGLYAFITFMIKNNTITKYWKFFTEYLERLYEEKDKDNFYEFDKSLLNLINR